ncbi:MAG: glycosyltransferase family 2 protein [Candidatus Omnitrophica bacterium]|nr:glycosyltransferase family 2 protein [Candidatus Omnitrophota bacterium]
MKISILIPAYNEEQSIQKVMLEIRSVDLTACGISEKEIILINDGSTDKTVRMATSVIPAIKVVHHVKNQGKGAALTSGIPHVSGDIILIQDADLEYSPTLYPLLIRPIVNEGADIVYGSRFLHKRHPEKMRLSYFLANRFGAILTNLLNGTHLTDPMTCFKVFRKKTLEGIKLTCRGFGTDAELNAKVTKKGFKIREVAIPYKARTFKEGKKFHPLCSLNVLWSMIRYSLIR